MKKSIIKNAGGYEYESTGSCPSWLDRFAHNYSIVEQTRERNDQSWHEQISAIMGGGQVKTVESVVKDFQERTGLTQHLLNISAQEEERKKMALHSVAMKLNDMSGEEVPELIMAIPESESFITNMAKSSFGRLAVEAIVEGLKECYGNNPRFDSSLAEEEGLKIYISNKLSEFQNKNDHNDANIGSFELNREDEQDASNTDMFANIGKL